ncbi:hypothetical protein [Janthinobacterium sp. PC23-8]|uniref:hypothetical protein n=1 Tax=Janthinobacterium sp. PC23-8 TaxID=2012679 RepID=UPI000B97540B|nr:hypothetical protein [Janthinobacterium sp. PC23-8]OYO30392.1 hypothetical protein CD932_04055 [Janthinobacterium sp. PC23-8]
MTDPIDPEDQRLRAMLRAALDAEAATMAPDTGLAQLHQRLRPTSWWRRLRWPTLPTFPSLAPWAITALASVCIAQAWLLWRPHDAAGDQLQWRSLPGVQTQGAATLRARFAPGATVEQVSAALTQAGATIVAGPLADGGYLLDAADPPAALRSLQSSGAIVATIELRHP